MFTIKDDYDFEAVLIAIGLIYYPYADPISQARYDAMTEEQKIFLKSHLTSSTN